MAVRRVVTGIDAHGRSAILSDDDGTDGGVFGATGLWLTDPVKGLDAVAGPDTDYAMLEPPPGGTSWRIFDLPTDEAVAEYLKRQDPDADTGGWHTTDTKPLRPADHRVAVEDRSVEPLLRPCHRP